MSVVRDFRTKRSFVTEALVRLLFDIRRQQIGAASGVSGGAFLDLLFYLPVFSTARDGTTISVSNPAYGEVIAKVANCSVADVERAVVVADAAWDGWKTHSAKGTVNNPSPLVRAHHRKHGNSGGNYAAGVRQAP
ncbi:aldehyde dehydrogenase family protein [Ruegeria sp. HKCCD8929]|uniref:aldehyde dehydrogenase family protein n=1 Tax=Ruegeria sp. HKCCD8929 TaxID=2683006 RepID=UPI001C2C19A9|nr:aldehyde dehydrogenase family protein [Ruegeria sp. HKCCD8929]